MKKRALISVSDKSGIATFASELVGLGYEIISTGGTYNTLKENNVDVLGVSDITGFPECLDGRVKTLHPAIAAGILAKRDNEEHMKQLSDLGIDTIDIVVINLYPFKKTIQKENVLLHEAIENIDIGGPTMIRAAAKNYQDVTVIIDPSDYLKVIGELKEKGSISQETKFYLAYKVFEHTSHYDTLIAKYLREVMGGPEFPDTYTITFEKQQDLRYGENPHQNAVYYKEVGKNYGALINAIQLHGKELSFNNINDCSGALDLLKEFTEPAVVAVKHANPCGVGFADTVFKAYMRAYDADPVSIFGGVIALNREVDIETAQEINKIFVEIVIAPSYSAEAFEILSQKKNIRLLTLEGITKERDSTSFDMKKVAGGLLVQEIDSQLLPANEPLYVTDKKPTAAQMQDLLFAWKVVKHVKSNAITLVKDSMTVGIGPGQTNRITALELAIKYAADKSNGAVMASDAFFPFPDCVEAAYKAGITAIIQPGGSINDKDSIDACNKYGIAMIFTKMRHFKH